jgi:hypothetical protein
LRAAKEKRIHPQKNQNSKSPLLMACPPDKNKAGLPAVQSLFGLPGFIPVARLWKREIVWYSAAGPLSL